MRDSGLLHRLLGIAGGEDLLGHPRVGVSWEAFIIDQVLMLDVRDPWFDLGLDRVIVAHAGTQRFPLAPGIEVVPAKQLLMDGLAG